MAVFSLVRRLFFFLTGEAADNSITVKVKKGIFRDVVNCSGELEVEEANPENHSNLAGYGAYVT